MQYIYNKAYSSNYEIYIWRRKMRQKSYTKILLWTIIQICWFYYVLFPVSLFNIMLQIRSTNNFSFDFPMHEIEHNHTQTFDIIILRNYDVIMFCLFCCKFQGGSKFHTRLLDCLDGAVFLLIRTFCFIVKCCIMNALHVLFWDM